MSAFNFVHGPSRLIKHASYTVPTNIVIAAITDQNVVEVPETHGTVVFVRVGAVVILTLDLLLGHRCFDSKFDPVSNLFYFIIQQLTCNLWLQ